MKSNIEEKLILLLAPNKYILSQFKTTFSKYNRNNQIKISLIELTNFGYMRLKNHIRITVYYIHSNLLDKDITGRGNFYSKLR